MKRAAAIVLCVLVLAGVISACSPAGEIVPDKTPDVVDVDAPTPGPRSCGIVINELMADNESFVLNCFDDWAELYNCGDEEFSLDSCVLTKKEQGSPVIPLDGMTVPANGYLVIMLGDSAPFRLDKDGDSLVLLMDGGLADSVEFDASVGDKSFTRDGVCGYPTPGFENSEAGYEEYLSSLALPGLRINEVVSSNTKYAPVGGEYFDLVEIYNGSGAPVDLSAYCLSDKQSEPERYRFPAVTLEAGGYFVVYCSGREGADHAPFKISSSGEKLYLSGPEGVVDFVDVPGDLNANESYGRSGAGFAYMADVTPGSENAGGYDSSVAAPSPNRPSGAYEEAFSLELSGGGDIYYTTDGSEPNRYSHKYSEPIKISHMAFIRAIAIADGRASEETQLFYTVGVEHAYPIVNVTMKQEDLTGSEGVLNHPQEEYEHQAYVTMMENGDICFSVPCGFKLHGNDSKKGEKQNFQLRFRSKYGMSKLEYKVFPTRDIEKFNSLILKGGSEDYVFCGFRDELCTSLVDGTTALSVQAYRPVILYLNGEYRGIYWLRERFDPEYVSQRLGVSDDSVNILKDYGDNVVSGSGKSFYDLIKYCKSHDLRNEEDYKYVMARIDYMSMIDWYVCRSYFGDTDLANIRFYSSTEDDGKWHWCFYDLDWALWNDTEDPIGKTARNDGHHVIMLALLKNPDFKDKFLKRYAQLMKTVLNEENICAKADEFVELMRPEIAEDREKYGYTVDRWERSVEQLKSFVKNGKRDKTVLAGIKKYFGLSDQQMKDYFGRTA
jgi:hypothetical protein